MSDPGKVST